MAAGLHLHSGRGHAGRCLSAWDPDLLVVDGSEMEPSFKKWMDQNRGEWRGGEVSAHHTDAVARKTGVRTAEVGDDEPAQEEGTRTEENAVQSSRPYGALLEGPDFQIFRQSFGVTAQATSGPAYFLCSVRGGESCRQGGVLYGAWGSACRLQGGLGHVGVCQMNKYVDVIHTHCTCDRLHIMTHIILCNISKAVDTAQ